MGKEVQAEQRASTLECSECGAIVYTIRDRRNNHTDTSCPNTLQSQEGYHIPEYCKHVRE